MKRLMFIMFILLPFLSVCQYPINQSIGSDSALVTSKGGLKGRIINYIYTDTASANLERVKQYPGAQIYTTTGGVAIWIRNSTATGWVKMVTSTDISNILGCNTLLQGGIVTWSGSGLIMDVTKAVYTISCKLYNSPLSQVSLGASHPTLPRLDVIAVDVNSQVVVIQGTPASNPSIPQVDPSTQLQLTVILVPAASTTPGNITQTIVYDENAGSPTEWTSSSSFTTGSVNFNSTLTPAHLTKNAVTTSLAVGTMTFTKSAVTNISNYSVLKIYVRLDTPPTEAYTNFNVFLTNGGSKVTEPVSAISYGYDPFTYNSYQIISIPASEFLFNAPLAPGVFDGVRIYVNGISSVIHFDYIQFQSGIINGSDNAITNIFRKTASDSVFYTKNGLNYFAYIDSTGGGGGSGAIPEDSLIEWGYEFYDTLAHRIQTGLTYPPADYGPFWYEWWGVMKNGSGSGGKYVISIGEGGAHPLLAGYITITDSTGELTGNVYPGTGSIGDYTFNGFSPFLYNKLHHFAVGYDGSKIVWFIDGVPNGFKLGTFNRHTVGGSTYSFCIGGSDHNNATMILLKIRGTEDYCPVDLSKFFSPFRFWYSNIASEHLHLDFTTPSRAIENLGNGFLGVKGYAEPQYGSFQSTPFGRYVSDSLDNQNWVLPKPVKYKFAKPPYTGLTSTIPPTAVVYDDFNRADYVPAWPQNASGGLDSTEGGTAGKRKYTNTAGSGGVQNKQAWVYRSGGEDTYVYASAEQNNQDVRVTVTVGDRAINAIARYTDVNNFIYVYTTAAGTMSAGKVVAGVNTVFGSWTAGNYNEIRLNVQGSTCDVYLDGAIKVTAASVSGVPSSNNAGFGFNTNFGRVDKFEVY